MTPLIKHRYRLTDWQFEDSISFTYKGIDTLTHTPILAWIIKDVCILPDTLPKIIQTAESFLTLRHERLLALQDYEYDGRNVYFIYAFPKDGQWLEDYLKTHTLSPQDSWHLLKQVLSGLSVLEQKRLCHGQLNWHSVIITGTHSVTLSHYALSPFFLTDRIQTLDVVKNAIFNAPEVLHLGRFSIQADLYSFGILAHKMLTQKWPFPAKETVSVLKQAFIKAHVWAELHESPIPEKLKKIILHCLQIDPEHRFKTISELVKTYKTNDIDFPKHIEKTPLQESIQDEMISNKRIIRKNIIKYGTLLSIMAAVTLFLYQIYLHYTTEIPETQVPSVTEISLEEATQILQANQLSLAVVGKRPHPTIPKGFVVETKPMAGRWVKQRRQIRVIVSAGVPQVRVPELIGRNLEQATLILGPHADAIQIERYDYSIEYLPGLIISQSPSPNAFVSSTENIQVVLSQGYPVTTNITRAKSSFFINRDHQSQVSITLFLKENWPPQLITIQYTHQNETKKLYTAQRQPGDTLQLEFNLDPGGTLEVFFNDNLALKQRVTHPPLSQDVFSEETTEENNVKQPDPTRYPPNNRQITAQ